MSVVLAAGQGRAGRHWMDVVFYTPLPTLTQGFLLVIDHSLIRVPVLRMMIKNWGRLVWLMMNDSFCASDNPTLIRMMESERKKKPPMVS